AAATVALGATGAAVSQLGYPRAMPFPTFAPEAKPLAELGVVKDPPTEKYYSPPSGEVTNATREINSDGISDRFSSLLASNEQGNSYSGTAKPGSSQGGHGFAHDFYKNLIQIQNGESNTITDGSVVFGYKAFPPDGTKRASPTGGLGIGGGMMGMMGGAGM